MRCLRKRTNALSPRRGGLFAWLFFAVPTAHADLPPPPSTSAILSSQGPLSSANLRESEGDQLLLGGILTSADDDAYLRAVNTGADPAKVAGPERLHKAELNLGGALAGVRTVLAVTGYHVNEPSVFQPLNSPASYLVYSRGPNKAAEACRKKGESLRSCPAYLDAKEVVLAQSKDNGATWSEPVALITAKNSGDESGPASSSALYVKGELWVYYSTARQSFMKENLFRARFKLDGTRLGEPEAVKIDGFTAGTSLENPQVVRLKCPGVENKFVLTMVANLRAQTALPLYWSEDGLKYKKVVDSLVNGGGAGYYSPTQLPGPASVEECHADKLKGVASQRNLMWAEKGAAGWQLRREKVEFRFP